MSEQIIAVYKNVLKPRGPDLDAGDLVLTTERLCFVQLAAWSPDNNANPLRTAIAGTLGGFLAALVSHVDSVRSQSPEIASLLLNADKKRDLLWGMNVEERLSATKSRRVIPIGEITIGKSVDGAGASVKDRRIGPLSAGNLSSFELYLTESPGKSGVLGTSGEQPKADLHAMLLTWKSQQMSSQTVEGYTCNFPAPQLFLNALKTRTLQKEMVRENEILSDTDYLARLESVFKEQAYRDQCNVLRSLRELAAGNLAQLLNGQLVLLLREQFKMAIQKEVPNWCGMICVPLSVILVIIAVVGSFLAQQSSSSPSPDSNLFPWVRLGCVILLFFSGGIALAWLASFIRLKKSRKRLQEQSVEPLGVEAELRGTAKASR